MRGEGLVWLNTSSSTSMECLFHSLIVLPRTTVRSACTVKTEGVDALGKDTKQRVLLIAMRRTRRKQSFGMRPQAVNGRVVSVSS